MFILKAIGKKIASIALKKLDDYTHTTPNKVDDVVVNHAIVIVPLVIDNFDNPKKLIEELTKLIKEMKDGR